MPKESNFKKKGLGNYRKNNDYNPKDNNRDNIISEKNDGETKQKNTKKYENSECLICLTPIYIKSAIWSCERCYIECHLSCMKTWILKQNGIEDPKKAKQLKSYSFGCPHCAYIYNMTGMPKYYCYCGKTKDPEFNSYLEPHTCDQVCGKKRGDDCPHPCPKKCHKGACPPCNQLTGARPCFCGKTSVNKPCSDKNRSCGQICEKMLNCKKHFCDLICHEGECKACE